MEAWREELYHSSGPWKKHKYIKKIGNVYYYSKMAYKHQKRANQYLKDFHHDPRLDDYGDYKGEAGHTFRSDLPNSLVRSMGRDEKLARSHNNAKLHTSNQNMSNMFVNMAKLELKSIPQEIISDGKNFINKLLVRK